MTDTTENKTSQESSGGKLHEFPGRRAKTAHPECVKNTEAYVLQEVLYSHVPLKPTPDIASGGNRNRRWGATFSLSIVPSLDETPLGPVMLPGVPVQFFAGDSLEELRDRIVYELDKAIELGRLAKEDPEEFDRVQRESVMNFAAQMSSGVEGNEAPEVGGS